MYFANVQELNGTSDKLINSAVWWRESASNRYLKSLGWSCKPII